MSTREDWLPLDEYEFTEARICHGPEDVIVLRLKVMGQIVSHDRLEAIERDEEWGPKLRWAAERAVEDWRRENGGYPSSFTDPAEVLARSEIAHIDQRLARAAASSPARGPAESSSATTPRGGDGLPAAPSRGPFEEGAA